MFAILVVDDDAPMRRLIALHLARAGYRPIEACDAREALDALDREHVDLMVVDVMMPGTDGCALTRCLRDAGYDLPVLMVTAKERIDDKRAGFAAGADDYLVKPVDFEEMLMRVAALLRRAKIDAEQRIEMETVCDRVALMRDGRIVDTVRIDAIRGNERVKEFELAFADADELRAFVKEACAGETCTEGACAGEGLAGEKFALVHRDDAHLCATVRVPS